MNSNATQPKPPPPQGESPKPADDPADVPNPATATFERLSNDLEELKEYASLYVATRVDGIKRTVRNIGVYAALGILGLFAAGALVATAVGLMVVGLGELLGSLFGRPWLGDMLAGLLVLLLLGGGIWLTLTKLTGAWRAQTVKKYEQRKKSQRERFGHDAADRARQARSQG